MHDRIGLLVVAVCVLTLVCESVDTKETCPNVKNSVDLSRKRRHLVFPDKSNMILTMSIVKAIMTHAPSGWNIALEIDVMFPLPDSKFTLKHLRRKLHHRQIRQLWEGIENAINFQNLNGRACILKSICEAKLYLAPPGKSLVHDILRAIFAAPLFEEEFVREVGCLYDELSDPHYCDKINDCPFSLLYFLITK
ncbi:uncharacterized protein LOC131855067 [Achroia grisella]|uniref:uncharacterized protein LOC131855067 n=1 Tax=Achroia grisella TaxID=688607 RepID=UPI0027D2ABFB|nr:uncharacterized protein LOC131855067 [Achroia grisella]